MYTDTLHSYCPYAVRNSLVRKSSPPSMDSNAFPFMRLPPELRLAIWEHTWPEARVAEIAIREDPTDPNWTTNHHMRITGRLSTFLRCEFKDRTRQDPPLEPSPDPVALHVCRESRAHTLGKYIPMRHSNLPRGSFYFHPGRDVFWLPVEYVQRLDRGGDTLTDLFWSYSEDWHEISLVVVGELYWRQFPPPDYCDQVLENIHDLRTVTIITDSEGFGEFAGVDCEEMDFVRRAKDQMAKDRRAVGDCLWATQYIDREGYVLCGFTAEASDDEEDAPEVLWNA